MQEELQNFFQKYCDAFTQGPRVIAGFYSEPCITARMGVVRVNQSRKDTEALFAGVDEQYRAKGLTHGEILKLDLRPMGTNSALATIHWAYKGAGSRTLWESTFTYNLYKRDSAWKILVQTMHDA